MKARPRGVDGRRTALPSTAARRNSPRCVQLRGSDSSVLVLRRMQPSVWAARCAGDPHNATADGNHPVLLHKPRGATPGSSPRAPPRMLSLGHECCTTSAAALSFQVFRAGASLTITACGGAASCANPERGAALDRLRYAMCRVPAPFFDLQPVADVRGERRGRESAVQAQAPERRDLVRRSIRVRTQQTRASPSRRCATQLSAARATASASAGWRALWSSARLALRPRAAAGLTSARPQHARALAAYRLGTAAAAR